MSFLAPWYLLGLAAVSLPILAHLLRQRPDLSAPFSSFLFLRPTPPRLTRRSRISDWLLLLLRVAAIVLIALAFARPYFQNDVLGAAGNDGEAIVVCLDASASMRRDGLAEEAARTVIDIAEDCGELDSLGLVQFSGRTQPLLSMTQWNEADAGREQFVSEILADWSPGWDRTELGEVARDAIGILRQDAETNQKKVVAIISDLQSGSRVDDLVGLDWPDDIELRLYRVGDDAPSTNASLELAAVPISHGNVAVRCVVRNDTASKETKFEVAWQPDTPLADGAAARPVTVDVPPGETRIVALPELAGDVTTAAAELTGDDHDFDNRSSVYLPRLRMIDVGYLGDGLDAETEDTRSMQFFVQKAFPETSRRKIQWQTGANAASASVPLMFVESFPEGNDALRKWRGWLSGGGTAVVASSNPDVWSRLAEAIDLEPSPFETHEPAEFALLTNVDFEHPMFRSLNEPRYSDFSKIHIWRHVVLNESIAENGRVLASFDSGTPAVVQWPFGDGRVIAFAFDWSPGGSDFQRSSKFVPVINALLEDAARLRDRLPRFLVSEAVDLSSLLTTQEEWEVVLPGGERVTQAKDDPIFARTDSPGAYVVSNDEGESTGWTVHLDPDESLVDPLADGALRAAGFPIDASPRVVATDPETRRYLLATELEARQDIWRWLILTAVLLLLVETILAGRMSRTAAVQ